MSGKEMKAGVEAYLTAHKDSLAVEPTEDEKAKMIESLNERSESMRKACEAERRWYKDRISEDVHNFIWREENDSGKMITEEKLQGFFAEKYADDKIAEEVLKQESRILEERKEQVRRKEKANKMFDKVLAEEFDRFLQSKKDTGGYMENYFVSVGRARRDAGYEMITNRALKRCGIFNDLAEVHEGGWTSYKREWYDYERKARNFEENKYADAADFLEQNVVHEASEQNDAMEDEQPIELTPETKEERMAALKAAKQAYSKQKTAQKAAKISGLAGLAALKGKGGLGD